MQQNDTLADGCPNRTRHRTGIRQGCSRNIAELRPQHRSVIERVLLTSPIHGDCYAGGPYMCSRACA